MSLLKNSLLQLWMLIYGVINWYYFTVVALFFQFINFIQHRKSLPAPSQDIFYSSAVSLSKRIRKQEITSEFVVQSFIRRIREINPFINCLAENRFDKALFEAKNIDRQIQNGTALDESQAPFLGIPFTIKDSFFIKDMLCTSGIPCRASTKSTKDAEVVSRMCKSGAICLATTNVPEVCMWWETNNSIYGRSRNPYDSRRLVGGSSGGEAGLLAAAGSVIGIGADVGGSIRMPAFFTGIFGHKPSKLLVPKDGIYPRHHGYPDEMEVIGPMCRFSEDLTAIFSVLVGQENTNVLKLYEKIDMSNVRIFYVDSISGHLTAPLDFDMRFVTKKVVDYFEQTFDAVCVPISSSFFDNSIDVWFNDMDDSDECSMSVEMVDGKGELNIILEIVRWCTFCSPHTLIALLSAGIEKVMKIFKDPQKAAKLRALRQKMQRQLEELLDENSVLLFPSHPTIAPFHNQSYFQPLNFIYTAIFNSFGVPVTQCPLGLNADGLPIGIQVIAGLNNDRLCLQFAKEIERGFGGWVAPK